MNSDRISILITSAGRRAGLAQCFRKAGERLGLELSVVACDLKPELSAACALADHSYRVPRSTAPDYIDAVCEIAAQHEVALLVPTIDPELLPLAQAAKRFADLGVRVHVSPPDVIEVVRDKLNTMQCLERAGIPVPFTITHEDAIRTAPGELPWPLFMKPSGGSASRGLQTIASRCGLPEVVDEPMILQHNLSGPEYTVNMYINQTGHLCCVVPHERLSIRAGEVEKGRTVRDPHLIDIGRRIAAALPSARGVLCFQVIRDVQHGDRVIEINGRFGGGYPLADYAGAPFAQWLLEETVGRPVTTHDDWREKALMLRYDAAYYQG